MQSVYTGKLTDAAECTLCNSITPELHCDMLVSFCLKFRGDGNCRSIKVVPGRNAR